VINGTTVSPDYPVWIVASSPEAFTPVINQDGTINSESNPAPGGSIVTFYATGWQSNFAPLADGQVATVAQDACLGACRASASTGGGIPFGPPFTPLAAAALYGGAAPGAVAGVTQFNVQLGTPAASMATSYYTVSVGIASNGVGEGVWIKP
jgi:uncharacterized protein (TIGR03437 family)